MNEVLLLDALRTPFGRSRGGLSGVRVDEPAAACVGVGLGIAVVLEV
ncbi:hypothetical protein OG884_31680 [Streptosporangium sp. NBC_01755]|nr:hypothetical protein [Streptosporangium sp. NBC_01755]WSC99345.1 hypothetical protein OG884_31680 [Streptosporangium sp. NBC_01755]